MWQRRGRPSPHSDGTDDDVRGVRSLSRSGTQHSIVFVYVCIRETKKLFLLHAESEIIQQTQSSSNESVTNVNVNMICLIISLGHSQVYNKHSQKKFSLNVTMTDVCHIHATSFPHFKNTTLELILKFLKWHTEHTPLNYMPEFRLGFGTFMEL